MYKAHQSIIYTYFHIHVLHAQKWTGYPTKGFILSNLFLGSFCITHIIYILSELYEDIKFVCDTLSFIPVEQLLVIILTQNCKQYSRHDVIFTT